MIAEEIEKLVEGTENVEENEVDSSTLRQIDNQNDLDTRLEPKSNKESPEVEITVVVQHVNVNEEEEESVEDDYELRRREKRKHVEESRNTPSPTTIRSPRIHSTLISSNTEKLQELMVNDPLPSSFTPSSSSPKSKLSASQHILSLFKSKTGRFKRYKSFFDKLQGCYGYLFEHLKTRCDLARTRESSASPASAQEQQYQLNLTMKDNPQLQHDDIPIWLALKYKFKRLHMSDTSCRHSAVRPRDQDDPHDDAHHEGENSAKGQKTVFGESSSSQVNESEPSPSTSEEISQTVDEAKLRKVVNEMLRQRCTSGDEHQYHIDQMQNFLKNDNVWESKKEIFRSYLIHKAHFSRLNLPKKSQGSCTISVIFSDDDIEERTSRWIVARRANGSIVSITESDYKNLNKNDIEDLYLLIINGKLGVESYQQKVNLTALTITFPGIEKYKVFSIVFEPVYGIIYKNNKKEKSDETSRDKTRPNKYHIDQMQKFLKNDIVWESRKEILVSPYPQKPTPVVQSCQRDPKAHALSLVNQDQLYLKKGNLRPEKIVMSLHKFPAVIFPNDDIEERTSRWIDKCVKKFNPYARYRHEHKFITEIIARRENGSIVSITESDYKNLNKNDIEDVWKAINRRSILLHQQLFSLGIEKYKVFSIVSETVYGIIYKNSKKEKRVMTHQEIHKFCDATLKRVLEGLKSYNNNMKHGYVTPSLSKEDVEYL
ncbi:hypothetical protein Tco_1000087 [Tanacetum coccineum]